MTGRLIVSPSWVFTLLYGIARLFPLGPAAEKDLDVGITCVLKILSQQDRKLTGGAMAIGDDFLVLIQ